MTPLARRTVLAAVAATVVTALPVFLLGGLAVQVSADIGLDATTLGLAISASFVVSAVSSVPAGRLAERLGSRRTMTAGVAVGGLGLTAIALLARSPVTLILLLGLAGIGNAFAQIGANLGLARAVPQHHQGWAFGVKQAAVPIATLLGGLAVPLVALTVGWRWAYVAGGALAIVTLVFLPPDSFDRAEPEPGPGARSPGPPPPLRTGFAPLLVIAAGGVLAAGSAGSLGGFLVASAVDSGIAPAAAGMLMALGSVVGIAGRLVDGYLADRREGGHLSVISLQLLAGSVGLVLLATGGNVAILLGTVLGYGMGWSWPGLLNFAVVRLNRGAPAAATGITQTGIYIGAGTGPLAFGLLVTATSFAVAWVSAAGAMIGAALLMLLARRLIHLERRRLTSRATT